MKLPFSIAIAYMIKHKKQSIISIVGVALGIGFFIGMHSMMRGMQNRILTSTIDTSPHVIMYSEYRKAPKQAANIKYGDDALVEISNLRPKEENRGIRNYKRIIDYLGSFNDLKVSPTVSARVFINYSGNELAVTLNGVDPKIEKDINKVAEDMIEGDFENLIADTNGIIIGVGVADKLDLELGSNITAVSAEGVTKNMEIVGIYETGIRSLDNNTGYATLKKVQILDNKINRINRINIKMDNVYAAEALANNLERLFGYRTESWQESISNIFVVFKIQNGVMYVSVGAILLVAGFGIFNIISTSVQEKYKDIAILKSIGFTSKDIEHIFLSQALIIAVLGVLLGWSLGYLGVSFLESIKFEIRRGARGGLMTSSEGFTLYKTYMQYLLGAINAFVTVTLASYIPAKRAARVNPVDIIRGDTT